MDLFANVIVFVYAGLASTAAFAYFRSKGHAVAESGAYGLMTMLMLYSWIAQVLFMIGAHRLLIPFQLVLLLPAVKIIFNQRQLLKSQIRVFFLFICAHPLPSLLLFGGNTVL